MSFLFLVLIYKERVSLFLPCILMGRDGLLVFLVSFVALCFFIPPQAFYRYRWSCYLFSAYLLHLFLPFLLHAFYFDTMCASCGIYYHFLYMHFLTPEHSLNLFFYLFLVSNPLQCTFFHSHHPFFPPSFICSGLFYCTWGIH